MHQIEAVMSKATTSKGKARFAEFKGASSNSELSKLMEYNEEKQNEDGTISKTDEIDKNSSMHEFKNAKEAEITDLDNGGKDILNRAFKRLEKGEISKEDYLNIRNGMKEFDQAIKAGDHVDVSTKFIDGLEKLNTVSDVTGEVVRHGSPLTGVFATYGLTKKGFKIERYETKGKKMVRYRVHNPEVAGIKPPKNKNRKTKIYDKHHMDQKGVKTPIKHYVKPLTGAKSTFTKAGWFGVALETGLNVKDNIRDGESTSKIRGDAGVDVGIGAISLAIAGAASAIAVGTFGAPIIGGAIVAAGVTYGFMGIMSIKVGDKILTSHVKSGIQSIAGWFK